MIAQPIRVLIVDDHPAFRVGLRALLGSRGDSEIEVVGEAESGEDALRTAIECTPDVVVMDLHMAGVGGIEATRQVVATQPHVRVLILTMLEDDDSVFAALQAGAHGYMLKGARQEEARARNSCGCLRGVDLRCRHSSPGDRRVRGVPR